MDEGTKKFDCWSCKYRGSVPGSAHISCKHPSVKGALGDPLLQVASIFGSVGRRPALTLMTTDELNIRANPRGVARGWFQFPFNYDPVWLENCDGYEAE